MIEVASNNDPEIVSEDSERLLAFLDHVSEHMEDGIVPSGENQARKLWDLRENVGVAAAEYGQMLSYDFSLGTSDYYRIVEETRQIIAASDLPAALKSSIITTGFGHIGDGNVHLMVSLRDGVDMRPVEKLVEPFVMEFVRKAKGSVSAEHGIGLQKTSFLEHSKSAPMIAYMQRIK